MGKVGGLGRMCGGVEVYIVEISWGRFFVICFIVVLYGVVYLICGVIMVVVFDLFYGCVV